MSRNYGLKRQPVQLILTSCPFPVDFTFLCRVQYRVTIQLQYYILLEFWISAVYPHCQLPILPALQPPKEAVENGPITLENVVYEPNGQIKSCSLLLLPIKNQSIEGGPVVLLRRPLASRRRDRHRGHRRHRGRPRQRGCRRRRRRVRSGRADRRERVEVGEGVCGAREARSQSTLLA